MCMVFNLWRAVHQQLWHQRHWCQMGAFPCNWVSFGSIVQESFVRFTDFGLDWHGSNLVYTLPTLYWIKNAIKTNDLSVHVLPNLFALAKRSYSLWLLFQAYSSIAMGERWIKRWNSPLGNWLIYTEARQASTTLQRHTRGNLDRKRTYRE